MNRTVLLGTLLLVLSVLPVATAAEALDADPCDKLQWCPIVRVGTDPVYACVGAQLGPGGALVVCAGP